MSVFVCGGRVSVRVHLCVESCVTFFSRSMNGYVTAR